MSEFSYLKLHPTRRLFLVFYAAGHTLDECCEKVPVAAMNGQEAHIGITRSTYEAWRKDEDFLRALNEIKDDPDWCHEHIVAPWMLAQDDLMQTMKALGHTVDPDRPWFGLSVKQRELLLNERGKLNREESQADRFLDFMDKLERMRERREITMQRALASIQVLPAPTSGVTIDAAPLSSESN
jgi:hypothetical protein